MIKVDNLLDIDLLMKISGADLDQISEGVPSPGLDFGNIGHDDVGRKNEEKLGAPAEAGVIFQHGWLIGRICTSDDTAFCSLYTQHVVGGVHRAKPAFEISTSLLRSQSRADQ
jgi:hypothetical protein